MKSAQTISKLMSFALRHKPADVGIAVDAQGWANIADLCAAADITEDQIRDAVETNNKQRFKISGDGKFVRANQGHSLPVDLGLEPVTPPETLWHGTAEKSLEAIRAGGLKPMSRQQVHLSGDVETARMVGMRHGKPAILAVRAGAAHRDGQAFYLSKNRVWLTAALNESNLEF